MSFGNPDLEAIRSAILFSTVTQPFGPTNFDLEGPYNGYAHFHRGIDLVLPGGPAAVVRAPASGRVVYAGYMQRGTPGSEGYGTLGNAVVIQTATGYRIALGHMSGLWTRTVHGGGPDYNSPWVQPGQLVRAGDIIGWQGSTGASSGVHLHLQINAPNGAPIDPAGGVTGQDAVKGVFSVLYHSLGFGGGYNPGQYDYPPPPMQLVFQPVGYPPPPPYGGTFGPGPDPQGLPSDPQYTGQGQGQGAVPASFGTDLLGGLLAGFNPGEVLPVLLLVFVGGVLILAGIGKLTKEPPVQAVLAPVADTVGAVKSAGGKAAALTAAA